jgi:hypothetical protein
VSSIICDSKLVVADESDDDLLSNAEGRRLKSKVVSVWLVNATVASRHCRRVTNFRELRPTSPLYVTTASNALDEP